MRALGQCNSPSRRRRWDWSCRLMLVVLCSFLSMSTTVTTAEEIEDEEIVVEAEPFLLRLAPKPQDFSLQMKVTVLWTVENIVRQYLEDEYRDSDETLFIGAGITGLSVINEDEDEFETIKFLGGAVAFHPSSVFTPNQTEIQGYIQDSLEESVVIEKLGIYFPSVTEVIYIPLALGNRGFGYGQPQEDEVDSTDGLEEIGQKPIPTQKPLPEIDTAGVNEEDADAFQNEGKLNEMQQSTQTITADDSQKTTIGLATGVALGGAIIVLLLAMLVESRRRRMDSWRESTREESPSLASHEERAMKEKASASTRYYVDEDQETTLRLPRIWGVTPSQGMDPRTTPSSDVSGSNEGDSVQDILTCTSMDHRRSIQNVESFEHQKRLVDSLKKEMLASNVELHPYMQDTHLDNTEPCALSPTDLSAAALDQTTTSRVPTWHAPSDSSFTGSGGSGYESPSSPFRSMFGSLRMPSRQKSSRRERSPYEPDNVEL